MDTNDIRAVADFDTTVDADLRYRAAYVLRGPDGDITSVAVDADALWLEACRIVSMAWELRQLERFGRHLLKHGADPDTVRDFLERAARDLVTQVIDGTIDSIDTFAGTDGDHFGVDGDGHHPR